LRAGRSQKHIANGRRVRRRSEREKNFIHILLYTYIYTFRVVLLRACHMKSLTGAELGDGMLDGAFCCCCCCCLLLWEKVNEEEAGAKSAQWVGPLYMEEEEEEEVMMITGTVLLLSPLVLRLALSS
jgi:hypothetical protein